MALNPDAKGIIDPYNHKNAWARSKKKDSDGLTSKNANTIREYLHDMEHGVNIGGSTRGGRSYTRLLTIKSRMATLARLFQTHTKKNLSDLTEKDVLLLFSKMRKGEIERTRGKGAYKSVGEYAVTIKAFWHWHQRRARKNGKPIEDITPDLDTTDDKPRFVYLDEDDVRRLADKAKNDYRLLMWFLFDSGIRTGGELHNIQKRDLRKDPKGNHYVLSIKDEASKTYGRDIKLLLCSEMLERHIQDMEPDDYLFTLSSVAINKYLKRLARRVFGEASNKKPRAKPYKDITAYDFRHSSACYWLRRYKTESALMYRFGWVNGRMIHYYTEFLGMRDTITQEDVLDADAKNSLQVELREQQQHNARLEEEMVAMNAKMLEMLKRMGTYDEALTEARELLRENEKQGMRKK